MLLLGFKSQHVLLNIVDNPTVFVTLSKNVGYLITYLTFFCLCVPFLHYKKSIMEKIMVFFGDCVDEMTHLLTKISGFVDVCIDLVLDNKKSI